MRVRQWPLLRNSVLSFSESHVPQILPVPLRTIPLSEFYDFSAPPHRLPDAKCLSLPAESTVTPWNARPVHIVCRWLKRTFNCLTVNWEGRWVLLLTCVRTCIILLFYSLFFFLQGGWAVVHVADKEAHCEEAAAWLDTVQRVHQ